MRRVILLVLLVYCLPATAEESLPDHLTSLPVLIQIPLPDGTNAAFGTGTYVDVSNKVFLVTAKHVLFKKDGSLLGGSSFLFTYAEEPTNQTLVTVNLRSALDGGLLKRHPTRDIAAIRVATTYYYTNGNVDIVWNSAVSSTNSSSKFRWWGGTNSFQVLTNVSAASEAFILGFPVELLKTQTEIFKVHSQVDFSCPLVRRGVISQRNHKDGWLIVDSGVYGGNSGGPLFVTEHPSLGVTSFKLCGIVTEFVPIFTRLAEEFGITNNTMVFSGYSVAEPIDYALEVMH